MGFEKETEVIGVKVAKIIFAVAEKNITLKCIQKLKYTLFPSKAIAKFKTLNFESRIPSYDVSH